VPLPLTIADDGY